MTSAVPRWRVANSRRKSAGSKRVSALDAAKLAGEICGLRPPRGHEKIHARKHAIDLRDVRSRGAGGAALQLNAKIRGEG
jgi:hypothetical protein